MADEFQTEASNTPDLSVVAPCFNEAESIGEFLRRVRAVCADCVGTSYEIVLVDDGSRDTTWQSIHAAADNDSRIVGVNLSRNFGHQIALSAGLSVANGNRVLIIDVDLQDPPELLPEMFKLMDSGADVVYGQRIHRAEEPRFKKLTAWLFYRLLRYFVDVNIPADTGDFRLLSRRTVDVLNSMPESHRFLRGMSSWIGFRQVPIEYERQGRFAGETHYPFVKMTRLAIDAITGFSTRPLRIATYLGGTTAFFAVVMAIYAIGSWVAGSAVKGWTSLMIVVLLFCGVQLITLGILGEYVGRLYTEVKRRPLFVVKSIYRQEGTPITISRYMTEHPSTDRIETLRSPAGSYPKES